jgi:hypothetical protein
MKLTKLKINELWNKLQSVISKNPEEVSIIIEEESPIIIEETPAPPPDIAVISEEQPVINEEEEVIEYRGLFFDNNKQTAPRDIIRAVKFGNTNEAYTNKFVVKNNTSGNPTRITALRKGSYTLRISAQLQKLSATKKAQVVLCVRKNDLNVPDTATTIIMEPGLVGLIATWDFSIDMLAGEYIEIIWSQNGGVEISNKQTPSVMLKINQII